MFVRINAKWMYCLFSCLCAGFGYKAAEWKYFNLVLSEFSNKDTRKECKIVALLIYFNDVPE